MVYLFSNFHLTFN